MTRFTENLDLDYAGRRIGGWYELEDGVITVRGFLVGRSHCGTRHGPVPIKIVTQLGWEAPGPFAARLLKEAWAEWLGLHKPPVGGPDEPGPEAPILDDDGPLPLR